MSKGKALLLAALPFFFCPNARASERPDPGRVWTEAADFLLSEDDREGILELQKKALQERPWDLDLDLRFAAYHLKSKDRGSLIELMSSLQSVLGCSLRPPLRKNACDGLARAWTGHLDSLFFYEDSAQKVEQVRRLLEAKDCPAALAVLKEVESKEGPAKEILSGLERVYKCLGDDAGASKTAEKLGRIRMFPSATDP